MRIFVVVTEKQSLPKGARIYFVRAHTDGQACDLIGKHLGADDFDPEFLENSGRVHFDGTALEPSVLGWSEGRRLLRAN